MAKADFIGQLQALNFNVYEPAVGFIAIDFTIPVGRFSDQKVTMAFQIGDNFPMACPGGPHFNTHLLPITGSGGAHPFGAIHASPGLGPQWQYWSRPFKEWNRTDKTVKTYLAHIKHLLDTIP